MIILHTKQSDVKTNNLILSHKNNNITLSFAVNDYPVGKKIFIDAKTGNPDSKSYSPRTLIQFRQASCNDITQVAETILNLPNNFVCLNGPEIIHNENIDSSCPFIRRNKKHQNDDETKKGKIANQIKKFNLDKTVDYFAQPFLQTIKNPLFIIDIDDLLYDELNMKPETSLKDVIDKFHEKFFPEAINSDWFAQRSASSGIFDKDKLKAHVFYYVDQLISVDEQKDIARNINIRYQNATGKNINIVDESIYDGVKLIFTSYSIDNRIQDIYKEDRHYINNVNKPLDVSKIFSTRLDSLLDPQNSKSKPKPKQQKTTGKNKPESTSKSNNNQQQRLVNEYWTNKNFWRNLGSQKEMAEEAIQIDEKCLHSAILEITYVLAELDKKTKGTIVLKALKKCPRATAPDSDWNDSLVEEKFNQALEGAKSFLREHKINTQRQLDQDFINIVDKLSLDYSEIEGIRHDYINTRFFSPDIFKQYEKYKVIFLLGSFNTGKTHSNAIAHPKRHDLHRVNQTSRIALVKKVAEDFELESHLDVQGIPIRELVNMKDIATTGNSLSRFPIPTDDMDSILTSDEIDEALMQIIGTQKKTPAKIRQDINHLIKRIKHTKKIIISQAFCSPIVLELLKMADVKNDEIAMITNTYKPFKGINAYITSYHDHNVEKLMDSIKAGTKIYVGSNTKETAKAVYNIVKQHIPEDKIMLIHSNNKGDKKQDNFLNKTGDDLYQALDNLQCIIASPTISSGNSWEHPDFTETFYFHKTLPDVGGPDTSMQAIHRNRCAKALHLCIDHNSLALQDDYDALLQQQIQLNKIAFRLSGIDKQSKTVQVDDADVIKISYIARDNKFKNNALEFMKHQLTTVGYDVIMDQPKKEYNINESELLGAKKEQKQKDIENFIQAKPMNKQELDEKEGKKMTSKQLVEYNKGKIQAKTGLDLQEINKDEVIELYKLYENKSTSKYAVDNLELLGITKEIFPYWAAYNLFMNQEEGAKSILRWAVFNILAKQLDIKYIDGRIEIPNNCYYKPEWLINSIWGRLIKRYYLALNALGLWKLDQNGLNSTQFGMLIRTLQLKTKAGKLEANSKMVPPFATIYIKEEKNTGGDQKNRERIKVRKIVGINPLVEKILFSRHENGVKNQITFARKCYEDGLKAGSLDNYVAGFQQDQNRKPQDIFYKPIYSQTILGAISRFLDNTAYDIDVSHDASNREKNDEFYQTIAESEYEHELKQDFWDFANTQIENDYSVQYFSNMLQEFLEAA
jgi:hypothetical protein